MSFSKTGRAALNKMANDAKGQTYYLAACYNFHVIRMATSKTEVRQM